MPFPAYLRGRAHSLMATLVLFSQSMAMVRSEEAAPPVRQVRLGLTAFEFRDISSRLAKEGYLLSHISTFPVKRRIRYAAIWAKDADETTELRHWLSQYDYRKVYLDMVDRSFVLSHISVAYGLGGRFAAIFQKGKAEQKVKTSLKQEEFERTVSEMRALGFRLSSINGYGLRREDRFIAIFVREAGPDLHWGIGLSRSELKAQFDELPGKGYRPVGLSGYNAGDEVKYALLWEQTKGPPWTVRSRLSPEGFASKNKEMVERGYQLVSVDGYTVEGMPHYAALWENLKTPGELAARAKRKRAAELRHQAVAQRKLGHDNLALQLLSKSIALDPSNAGARYSRAKIHYRSRDAKEALSDLDRAVRLSPGYTDALLLRSSVHRHLGRLEDSIADVDRVIELKPESDYAAGLKKSLEVVRRGPDWDKTYRTESEHYRLSTSISQDVAVATSNKLEEIHQVYTDLFGLKGAKTKGRLIVKVFAEKSEYERYLVERSLPGAEDEARVEAHWQNGQYSRRFKELLLRHDSRESKFRAHIYHEAFHQFLDYLIASPPPWFNEGLAEHFEVGRLSADGFQLGRVQQRHLKLLRQALAIGEQAPIEKLLTLSRTEFYDSRPSAIEGNLKLSVHYAEAWSFIHFLIHSEDGQYKKVIRDYYQALKAGQRANDAFQEVLGRANFKKVQKAWEAYVLTLGSSG